MDKSKIVAELKENVKKEIEKSKQAFETTKTMTREDDMKSEDKYDTRGIEAGYLAGAQQNRLDELKLELQMLDEIKIRKFSQDEEVAIGALVGIEFNGIERSYFISPTAGGTMLNIDGQVILVISVFSPMGSEAIGLKKGDSFEVETPKENREYTITSIS